MLAPGDSPTPKPSARRRLLGSRRSSAPLQQIKTTQSHGQLGQDPLGQMSTPNLHSKFKSGDKAPESKMPRKNRSLSLFSNKSIENIGQRSKKMAEKPDIPVLKETAEETEFDQKPERGRPRGLSLGSRILSSATSKNRLKKQPGVPDLRRSSQDGEEFSLEPDIPQALPPMPGPVPLKASLPTATAQTPESIVASRMRRSASPRSFPGPPDLPPEVPPKLPPRSSARPHLPPRPSDASSGGTYYLPPLDFGRGEGRSSLRPDPAKDLAAAFQSMQPPHSSPRPSTSAAPSRSSASTSRTDAAAAAPLPRVPSIAGPARRVGGRRVAPPRAAQMHPRRTSTPRIVVDSSAASPNVARPSTAAPAVASVPAGGGNGGGSGKRPVWVCKNCGNPAHKHDDDGDDADERGSINSSNYEGSDAEIMDDVQRVPIYRYAEKPKLVDIKGPKKKKDE
ncbi:MAG: hypothetical protein Q9165_002992 [Trypethelium subeluteriae]